MPVPPPNPSAAARAHWLRPCLSLALALVLGGCSLALELDPPSRVIAPMDGGADGAGEAGADARIGDGGDAGAVDRGLVEMGRPDASGPDGGCVPVGERCNGRDDDCDGRTDEDWPLAGRDCTVGLGVCARIGRQICGPDALDLRCDAESGLPEPELCNELDDDCDGLVDEGVMGCCVPGSARACGLAQGQCSTGMQSCDLSQQWGPCTGTGPTMEICDGLDQDCDGVIDNGVTNACGRCGDLPSEVCDGIDQDCDGDVDEGSLNACGACGAVPVERCDGIDQDCDGNTDEGACHMYVFDERAENNTWTTRTEGSRGPFDTAQRIQAAVAALELDEVWVITNTEVWFYHLPTDTWRDHRPRETVFVGLTDGTVFGAASLPSWWGEIFGNPRRQQVDLIQGNATVRYLGAIDAHQLEFDVSLPLIGAWETPQAPMPARIVDVLYDVGNHRGWWPGDPSSLCDNGVGQPLGPVLTAFTDNGQLNVYDAGHCFLFFGPRPARDWHPFSLPDAPDPTQMVGIAHFAYPPPEAARATNVVLVR